MSALYPDLSNTTYPNTVDTFTQFLDILASDGDLVKQYQIAIQNGDTATANAVIQQIPAYKQKLLTAQDLNKFIDAIIALERFYKTDITPYTNQKQAEWQAIIDQFAYLGVYNSSVQYKTNNYVSFVINGVEQLYIALSNPPVGTLPTNTTYWRILSLRGPRGYSGDGLSFIGAWDSTTSYIVGDCVNYDNALWWTISPNVNQTPYEGSTYWELIYRGVPTVYPVTTTPPSIQQDGELWFQIIS